jgi:hypothetical protein
MRKTVADATSPSRLVRLTSLLNLTAGALIIAGVIVQIFVSTKGLVTPVDVGGTLLGGSMDFIGGALIWTGTMCAILLVALLRLPGFRLTWGVAGGLPVVLGAVALWIYPNDYGGNLMFSPQRSEIIGVMMVGGAFLGVGAMLHRYVTIPAISGPRSRLLSTMLRLLAMAGLALLFIVLPIAKEIDRRQPPLPACAHDSNGQQLTLCL